MPRMRSHTWGARVAWGALLLTALSRATNTFAQSVPELDSERFSPATGPDSYFGVEATRTPGPGSYVLQLTTSYEGSALELPAGTRSDLTGVRLRLATWLSGEVGIGGRLALGAALPAYPYQSVRWNAGTAGSPSNDQSFDLGDGRVRAQYRVLGESSSRPDAPKDGPGVAFAATAVLPTHTGNVFAGESSVRTELALLADFQLLGAGAALNLGWRHRFEGVVIDRVAPGASVHDPLKFHDELSFGAALKLPLPPAPKIVTMVETRGATDFRSAQATSIELDLGARVLLGSFSLSFGAGLGFAGGLGTPDGRLLLGLSFSPLDADSDGDGIDDAKDQCPFLAEDPDGFQDNDGCPDPDNDNDLIPDIDDLCPNVAAEEGQDENEDGCTDVDQKGTKTKAQP